MSNTFPTKETEFQKMNPLNNDEIDLSQLLRTLWRRKIFIAFVTLIGLLIGGWYAYGKAVPVYTATATVALESRREQVVDIDNVVSGLSGNLATINTEVEVFKSRGLVEKLVLRLNLLEDPEFNGRLRPKPKYSIGSAIAAVKSAIFGEQAPTAAKVDKADPTEAKRRILDSVISAVSGRIKVSNVRASFVFKVTATTKNPKTSAALANTLAELYILEQLETKFDATEQATVWLTERVSDLQVELEAAEAAVKEFNSSAELVSPEALVGLNRQIKDIRDRLKETTAAKVSLDQRLKAFVDAKNSNDLAEMTTAANDPKLNRLVQLMQNSGEANPDRSAFDARFDQIIARAQLEVTRANQQIDALEVSVKEQELQIGNQSADLVQLQQLQREAEASRLIYEFFLSRLKETSVQQGIQQADSRMLSRAVTPRGPSAPRKTMILAFSLIVGALLGATIVLARELSQNTFRDASELEERSGYTVIGQIPAIPARRRKNVLKYLTDKPSSAAAEAIRNLRTSVLLSDLDNPPKVIMSTSSIPGEGKTTQSLALTQNLTGLGKKVLLIEGDIRRRVFAEYFDVKTRSGLISVLSGDATLEEAVIAMPELGADILVGEKAKTNAADVFSSDKFTNFLKYVREQYDYIIIDTPPVLAVPDARIIAQSVDTIIYTVKWDSTSHRQVREGVKSLEDVNIRIAGLVLSQINARGMKRYGYGDSYGAYSAYYDN